MSATRSGDHGYLVAANYPGLLEKGIRKFLDWKGLELGLLKGKDRQMQAFMRGRGQFSSLGLPAKWEAPMTEAKALMQQLMGEAKQKDRWVSFRLKGSPKSIARVRVVDQNHGNPLEDAAFQARFAPYRKGRNQAAMGEALESLREQGVSQAEIDKVEAAFRQKSRSMPGVSNSTQAKARSAFEAAVRRLAADLPGELIQDPATFPEEVDSRQWARLEGDILKLRVPPMTAVLVDLSW